VLAALAGGALGAVCFGVVCWVALRHDRLPELTAAQWQESLRRWDRVAPANYDIEVRVQGPQPGVYRVTVRGGQVESATRNGYPLRQLRTLGTWSVPGMFGTIERDLMHVQDVATGRDKPDTCQLLLRAQFDPRWGYPARYQRVEWSSQTEVVWEVTHFDADPKVQEPVGPEPDVGAAPQGNAT
jgi:hypothetical protein